MSLFTPGRRAKNKRFSYDPRFYNSKKDEKIKRRMRFQAVNKRRRSPLGLIYFALLFAMAMYIYQVMS